MIYSKLPHFGLGVLYVDRTILSDQHLTLIKNNLTVVDEYTGEVSTYYYEEDNYLIVPKFYNSVFKQPIINYDNAYTEGEEIDIRMINYNNPRTKEQEKAVNFFLESDLGILKAYTGFGKTWCAIKFISEYKRKTLIIVNKTLLTEQWRSEIVKFTNLKEDDIGIISGEQSINKNIDKPVVIAIVNTLASILKESLLPKKSKMIKKFAKANFGVTILDEVHKTSTTPVFSRSAGIFLTKKVFGLSATPRKSNPYLTNILNTYFGNTIFIPDSKDRLLPKVNVITYNSDIQAKTFRWFQMNSKGSFIFSRYRKKLGETEQYKSMITALLKFILDKDSTTGVLLAAHEINFLKPLQEHINKELNITSGLIISENDSSEHNNKVIFATYQSVIEAISISHLNKLVLLTPISSDISTEQISGRITRNHTNKEADPEIFDLIDTNIYQPNRMFIRMFYKRKKVYDELGMRIISYNVYDPETESFLTAEPIK